MQGPASGSLCRRGTRRQEGALGDSKVERRPGVAVVGKHPVAVLAADKVVKLLAQRPDGRRDVVGRAWQLPVGRAHQDRYEVRLDRLEALHRGEGAIVAGEGV